MDKSLTRKEHNETNTWKALRWSVGKAATVSKGSNSFKAFYIYTFNRNVFLEAAMAPLKLSNKEAVVSTITSAISDSCNELPLGTKTTCTPVGNRKHTERSFAKQILQAHRHQHHHLQ
jgi:hypothetical protein